MASTVLGVASTWRARISLSHRRQVGPVLALVEGEHDVGPAERPGGLDRDMVGIAGADADDEDGAHGRESGA